MDDILWYGKIEDGEFLLGFPIKDYFFKYVIPGEEKDPTGAAKTVWTRVVRADVEIHYVVDMVAQFMAKKQDIKGAIDAYNNWDLLITFKGQGFTMGAFASSPGRILPFFIGAVFIFIIAVFLCVFAVSFTNLVLR